MRDANLDTELDLLVSNIGRSVVIIENLDDNLSHINIKTGQLIGFDFINGDCILDVKVMLNNTIEKQTYKRSQVFLTKKDLNIKLIELSRKLNNSIYSTT